MAGTGSVEDACDKDGSEAGSDADAGPDADAVDIGGTAGNATGSGVDKSAEPSIESECGSAAASVDIVSAIA